MRPRGGNGMVTNHLVGNQTDRHDKQNQDGWNMLSPNVIRGVSAGSLRSFPLFEPAADFAAKEVPQHTPQENSQEPDVSHAFAAESQQPSEHEAAQVVGSPEAILEHARQEAAHCLQEARVKAEAIKTGAYQEGFQQGLDQGQEKINQHFHAVIQSFCQATEGIFALRQKFLSQAEDDIVTLACKLAEKIISHEIQTQPDIFTTILHQALDRSSSSDCIVVYMNPNDLQIAQKQQHNLIEHLGKVRQLTIETDETIERGGCIVRTDLGEIDARIDVQIKELEMGLQKQYHASTEDNPS